MHLMLKQLELKLTNSLHSKVEELLEKCVFAGNLFLMTVDIHHQDADPYMLKMAFINILRVFEHNKSLYRSDPDPDLVRNGARLIAKLAKKYPKFGEDLKKYYKMNCNVTMINEQELVQLIQNIEF